MSERTLLSPFKKKSLAPAIVLPASSPTPNVTLSFDDLAAQVEAVRVALDSWDGNGNPLKV